jgi:aspartate/glutamate racemase
MILPDQAHGIPFFNTTAIHIESIVRHCLAE